VLPSKKYLLIAIITLATLLLGFVFSGYLTLLFLGLDTKLFTWNTYYQYFNALDQPQVAPFVGKIRWAGYVGFGLPLLVLVVTGLVLLLKKDKRSLHGDARFATGADLARHGMFKKTGQHFSPPRPAPPPLRSKAWAWSSRTCWSTANRWWCWTSSRKTST